MIMDLTNPPVTVVEKSTKGKTMLWYGDNRVGKTKNAVKMPRPFAIAFENGLNAIAGLPYWQPKNWSEAKKLLKELAKPEVKALYDTILIDTLEKAGRLLIKNICAKHGVDAIGDANNGFGAYSEVEHEWDDYITTLANEGYTVVIIAHDTTKQPIDPETGKKYERIVPKGDKRVVGATCDLVDIIGFCESNGYDEEGNERMSTMYFKDAKHFKAGSRWDKIVKSITPFNVPNLTKAIVNAITAQEQEDGADNYVEKKEAVEEVVMTFEKVCDALKACASTIKDKTGNFAMYTEIVENKLGEGAKVSNCTKKHQEILEEILDELNEKIKTL
jgi:hypothetical protein